MRYAGLDRTLHSLKEMHMRNKDFFSVIYLNQTLVFEGSLTVQKKVVVVVVVVVDHHH